MKFEHGDRVIITKGTHMWQEGTIAKMDNQLNGTAYMVESVNANEVFRRIPEEFLERADEEYVFTLGNENKGAMDDLTFKKAFKNYDVSVYDAERTVPHFHFYPKGHPKAGGCICMKVARYFPHEGHTEHLNAKGMKKLIEFLNAPYDEKRTNWDVMIAAWNQNKNPDDDVDDMINPDQKIPAYQSQMPDYQDDKGE